MSFSNAWCRSTTVSGDILACPISLRIGGLHVGAWYSIKMQGQCRRATDPSWNRIGPMHTYVLSFVQNALIVQFVCPSFMPCLCTTYTEHELYPNELNKCPMPVVKSWRQLFLHGLSWSKASWKVNLIWCRSGRSTGNPAVRCIPHLCTSSVSNGYILYRTMQRL